MSDSTIDASSLVSISSSTSGTVFASEVGTIKGSTDSINNLYDLYTNISSSSLGNESITITDKVGSSSALTTLASNTTGIIDADSLYTIKGSLEELNSLYLDEQFIGLNNEDITLTDLEISSTYDLSLIHL